METSHVTGVLSAQFSPILASVLLALSLLLARYLILRYWLKRMDGTSAERRKAMAISRGVVAAVIVFGMAFIWAPELQAFALSVAAFAVALVIGMKELLLATLGGIYRLITGAYKVGDWITVGAQRGEVVDFGLTSTTLEMLGPGKAGSHYTGHRIVFPNSKLLTEPVVNEHELGPYVMHTIAAPVKLATDIEDAEAVLRAAARKAFDPADARFRKFVAAMKQVLDVAPESMEPKFQLEYTEAEKGFLRMSLFLPINQISEKDYEIMRAYMAWLRAPDCGQADDT